MHILYFHQHFSTPQGSTANRSYQMAQKLLKNGHQVTMICGSYEGGNTGLTGPFEKGKRSGNVDGIDVVEFELEYSNTMGFIKRSMVFLSFALKSIKVALFTKADLIFATSTPLTAGIPGIFAKFFKRQKFVFEVRDLWPELPREMKVITNPVILWMMGVLEYLSYKSANRCIGLSPGIAEGIMKRGIKAENVTMIPNGCDLELFDNAAPAWRPEGVKDDDFMAVFTGTHGIANGLERVLDAAAVLKTRKGTEHIKFVLIGRGKLKQGLIERAKNEGLDNIVFCDPVPKPQLTGLMEAADVGMQILANIPAFYYGTSPNKFFDYLSAGLPVLCNYPGWVSDLISEFDCGEAVEADNPEAFADALVRMAGDKDRSLQQGKNANKLARAKFSRDDLSDQFVEWVTNV